MQTLADQFLLWGHNLAEYQAMFELTPALLNKKILDCASGFATFNLEMHEQKKSAVSCDRAYDKSPEELRKYMTTGLENLLNKVKSSEENFNWQHIKSFAEFKQERYAMLNKFLDDFPLGKKEKRYIAGTLPDLSFANNQFNLAVCAYFLFTTDHSLEFHVNAIKEMCRVAGETRIYPLLDENGEPSQLLAPVILLLQQSTYGIEIKQVNYEFQKNSNAMLRVWAQGCEV